MGVEYFVFMIPLAGIALAAFGVWTKHREKIMIMQSVISAVKAAQYAVKNEQLEQRVRVLERIVTDKGADLANEIEDLRDEPRIN